VSSPVLEVEVRPYRVFIGKRFSVSFQRAHRIPQSQQVHTPPTSLGALPVHRVADYGDRFPQGGKGRGGVFIPVSPQEALWLGFSGADWKPNAVKVGVAGIDAVSGKAWDARLHVDPQDYLVCPPQLALDGIHVGEGSVRQFVATPAEQASTVESEVAEHLLVMYLIVYAPKPGRFPEETPPNPSSGPDVVHLPANPHFTDSMGLGLGGTIAQQILPDPYGIDTWDPGNYGNLVVLLVDAEEYREVTGLEPPPPLDKVQAYTKYRLP